MGKWRAKSKHVKERQQLPWKDHNRLQETESVLQQETETAGHSFPLTTDVKTVSGLRFLTQRQATPTSHSHMI